MSAFLRYRTAWVVAAVFACCDASLAGLAEGLDALRRNDYAAAAKELRPLAERGDAEAQYRVGLMHEFGKGFPQDKAQGIAWFRKAAAQGHSAAQQELGVIYSTGDGVAQDDAQAAAWFRKAADQGNATAQYNLGLLYAKGAGVKRDDREAIDWMRKAAAQGLPIALYKIGVAYENGEGVAKDAVLAYANYAIAARGGNREYAAQRDAAAARLTPAQLKSGQALAEGWTVGQPLPTTVAAAGTTAAGTATAKAPAPNRCTATGTMGGEKFALRYCTASVMGDAHSVAIWFSEDAIAPAEAESFALSSYADAAKGGRQRTQMQVMFCPGGGTATASPAAVRSIDLNTNHAKSPLAGVQWVVEAGKDFKVEKLAGEVKPGGTLSGRIVGRRDNTAFTLDFEVTLPTRDAAAGMACK